MKQDGKGFYQGIERNIRFQQKTSYHFVKMAKYDDISHRRILDRARTSALAEGREP